jgi:hypothetical protein
MNLLKIICFFFLIYFVRRFIQLYRAMGRIQEMQKRNQELNRGTAKPQRHVVEADFKVVD